MAYITVPLSEKDEERVRMIIVKSKKPVGPQCAILIREALDARERAAAASAEPKG